MKTSFTKSYILFLFVVILATSISSCSFGQEKVEYFPTRYFLFEPETILESITQNDANLFTPVDIMPPDNTQPITVNWKQSDYIKILATLFTSVLRDNINDWQLYSISFSQRCIQYDQGFQGGNFTFFKNAKESKYEVRIVRTINITAWNKTISISNKEYRPKLVNWSSLDLATNKITADDALKIANQAGGMDARLAVENNCNTIASFISDSLRFDGWVVRYEQYSIDNKLTGKSLLEVEIDPFTGKYNK